MSQDDGRKFGGLAQTLDMLNARKVTVVVLGQVPDYPVSVPLCVAQARFQKRDETRCVMQSAKSVKNRFQFVEDYFQRLRRRYDFHSVRTHCRLFAMASDAMR